jgi:ketosteroid isomerase-like protein
METCRLAMVFTVVVGFAGCGAASAGLSEADKAAIRTASQRYVEADEARNIDGMLQVVSEDAVYMPPSHVPIEGREAIREFVKPHPWEKLSQTPAEIDGRGDVAFVRGAWSVTFNGKPVTGNYIEIWQKQSDAAWRIIRKVWNTNTN